MVKLIGYNPNKWRPDQVDTNVQIEWSTSRTCNHYETRSAPSPLMFKQDSLKAKSSYWLFYMYTRFLNTIFLVLDI